MGIEVLLEMTTDKAYIIESVGVKDDSDRGGFSHWPW